MGLVSSDGSWRVPRHRAFVRSGAGGQTNAIARASLVEDALVAESRARVAPSRIT
jgi:hypothetical protein